MQNSIGRGKKFTIFEIFFVIKSVAELSSGGKNSEFSDFFCYQKCCRIEYMEEKIGILLIFLLLKVVQNSIGGGKNFRDFFVIKSVAEFTIFKYYRNIFHLLPL